MYQLTSETSIIRRSDNAFIPINPDNRDYQEYLAWIEAGNTPILTPQPVPPTKAEQISALNAEYDPQRAELDRQLFRAIFVWQDAEIGSEIRAETMAVETEYYTKAEAIWNE